jgi:UrcA family protein
MTRKLLIAAAGILLAAGTASAADMKSVADGIVIKYSPDELADAGDAENLYRKLKSASRKVCGDGPGVRTLLEHNQVERCYEQVLADVVRKINQPLLTSIHQSRSSKVG